MNIIYLSGEAGDVPSIQAAGAIPVVTAYAIDSHCTLLRTCRRMPAHLSMLTLTDRFAGHLDALQDRSKTMRLCAQMDRECRLRGFRGVFFNSDSFSRSAALLEACASLPLKYIFCLCQPHQQIPAPMFPLLHPDACAPFDPQVQLFTKGEARQRGAFLPIGATRFHLPQLETPASALSLSAAFSLRHSQRCTLFFDPLRQQEYFTCRTADGADSIHLDTCKSLLHRVRRLTQEDIHTFFLSWRPLCALCKEQGYAPRQFVEQLKEAELPPQAT